MTVRYSWPTLTNPPSIQIENILIDGTPLPSSLVDEEHLRIDLDGLDPWKQFECTISINTGEGASNGPLGLIGYVIASSRTTASRVPYPLHGNPPTGQLSLLREDVSRSITLEAEVAARYDGRFRVIGAGIPWTIILDRNSAPVPVGRPPFNTVWVDFTAVDAPDTVRRSPGAHAVMDLEAGTPRLFLNSAIDGFQTLLHADKPQLERRRLQNLLGTDVARYATSCLFRAAMTEVGSMNGGAYTTPDTALYRQVCEAVAAVMTGVGPVDELYEQMAEAADTSADRSGFWARVDIAIDALVGRSAAIEKVCKEVKHA